MSNLKLASTVATSFPRAEDRGPLPFTEAKRDQVLSHLEEILLSPAFRNSKRYCALLRYVVEQALDGQAEYLKERTIGVEAFGRQADYDTNTDHSVRSVAGEVRRRLAQYYMEFGPNTGVRIDLLPGSYAPQIRFADPPLATEAPDVPVEVTAPSGFTNSNDDYPPRIRRRVSKRKIVAIAVAMVALLVFGAAVVWKPNTAFDRLWNPILSSPNQALLCVGGGRTAATAETPATILDFDRSPERRMNVSDAFALAALTGTLQSKGKQYRILNRASATSYKDLQQGPFILIGALNNEWTLRLTSGLRFTFDHQGSGIRIVDRQNPQNTAWSLDPASPFTQPVRDYAIVTRLRDPRTEQTGLFVAGLGSWGTQAAGEFVSNENHLRKLESLAPRDWEQKNLQVVIGTDVIRGSSGPPIVLTAYFW